MNVLWHQAKVTRESRERLNNHKSMVLWFTGLPSSGKSTLSQAVEERLHQLGCRTFVLDGDNVRHGLCSDLGFTNQDRTENIRRVGEVAKLLLEAGVIVLAAFVSPLRDDRERLRTQFYSDEFLEIYCRCPLQVCEQRDVKSLYRRAREGNIADFTGISSPYEEPLRPDLIVETDTTSLDSSVELVMELLKERGKTWHEHGAA